MTVQEKLAALRQRMKEEGFDAYIVSGTDPHNSEYLPDIWKQRRWISGFTGSFGTIVVTQKESGIWTDTRYFIQVGKELANTEIKLHKLRVPDAVDYPEWLAANLPEGCCLGVDGFCTSTGVMKTLQSECQAKKIKIVSDKDLVGDLWSDRPSLPDDKVFLLKEKYSGESTEHKLQRIHKYLTDNNADYALFSALDEIAWLYNIRSNDVAFTPVAISYAVVGKEKAWLFIKKSKISTDVQQTFDELNIEVCDYESFPVFIEAIKSNPVFCLDPNTLNYAIYNKVAQQATVVEKSSPVLLWKALKNDVEIEGFRQACVKDGVALTKFYHWLETHIGKEPISEVDAEKKLSAFRAEQQEAMGDSFNYISAYGPNAALPHYFTTPESFSQLQPKGFYLLDSGGHYLHGTTDITRTVPLGPYSDLEREDYTLVLKGMINMSRCIFTKGTTGTNLDILPRQFLWQHRRNYGHGTGHGIGHFLCVHEGPQDIRLTWRDQEILPGMVTSNEPGIYREGEHGVRHENINVCVHLEDNEFGSWYGFETLTLCYIDTAPIVMDLMDKGEIEWLNDYHQTVYKKLAPLLNEDDKNWLKEKTKAI